MILQARNSKNLLPCDQKHKSIYFKTPMYKEYKRLSVVSHISGKSAMYESKLAIRAALCTFN